MVCKPHRYQLFGLMQPQIAYPGFGQGIQDYSSSKSAELNRTYSNTYAVTYNLQSGKLPEQPTSINYTKSNYVINKVNMFTGANNTSDSTIISPSKSIDNLLIPEKTIPKTSTSLNKTSISFDKRSLLMRIQQERDKLGRREEHQHGEHTHVH